MKRIAAGLLIASVAVGGIAPPAEAGGGHQKGYGHHYRYHGPHKHHYHHHKYHHRHHDKPHSGHRHDHFLPGFLAGTVTVLLLDALRTPAYPPAPVCQDVWVPGHWERTARSYGSYTTYSDVWVNGYWQRQCS